MLQYLYNTLIRPSRDDMLPKLERLSGQTHWTHIGLTNYATLTSDGIRIVDGYCDVIIPCDQYTYLFCLVSGSIVAINTTDHQAHLFKLTGKNTFDTTKLDYTDDKYFTQWVRDDRVDYCIDGSKVTMTYNKDGSMGLYKEYLTFGLHDQVTKVDELPDFKKDGLQYLD